MKKLLKKVEAIQLSNDELIEYRIYNNGEVKISKTSAWWGGINSGFSCTDGCFGNSCEKKYFKKYFKKTLQKQRKNIEKEINSLNKELTKLDKLTNKIL